MKHIDKRAYLVGFFKEAMANGVNPVGLLKYAANRGISNDITERAGTTTSTLTLGTLGSLIGKAGGRGLKGGVKGGVAGVSTGLLSALIGKITGVATSARTGAEQAKHNSTTHFLANLLLPGYGKYNAQKRLERARLHMWT
jgi:hypothetical protein